MKEQALSLLTSNQNQITPNIVSSISVSQLVVAENVYDLPTPSNIDMLPPPPPPQQETQSSIECPPLTKPSNHTLFFNESINNSNSTSLSNRTSRSNSIGPQTQPPPVPPKPQFKRLNSIGGGENGNGCEQTIEQKIMAARKRSLELKTTINNPSSNGNSNGNNPLLINELSTILARQKKKIEDSMNNSSNDTTPDSSDGSSSTNESQSNKSTNDRLACSPTLTKKPPPPPRSDRSQLSRRPSNDSRI